MTRAPLGQIPPPDRFMLTMARTRYGWTRQRAVRCSASDRVRADYSAAAGSARGGGCASFGFERFSQPFTRSRIVWNTT